MSDEDAGGLLAAATKGDGRAAPQAWERAGGASGARSYVKGRPSAKGRAAREAYFGRDPSAGRAGALTPLQKRMQTGGA